MAKATFTDKEQDYQAETTTYWFRLEGDERGAGHTFDGDTYGIVEGSSDDAPVILCCDGRPLTPGDREYMAVLNVVKVTDEHRLAD